MCWVREGKIKDISSRHQIRKDRESKRRGKRGNRLDRAVVKMDSRDIQDKHTIHLAPGT